MRLTELLKQPVYHPLALEDEVVSLFSGARGYLDTLEVGQIKEFEAYLLDKFKKERTSVLKEIREKKVISDELEKELAEYVGQCVAAFKKMKADEAAAAAKDAPAA